MDKRVKAAMYILTGLLAVVVFVVVQLPPVTSR